ncbi:acyl-CoA dehydrogenase family protein [Streptomyces sp. PSKA54]|uniref:Acyl-CoA dehydrogenase family protein n=1 Tax=Streptomyces himalayensis subsp. aureolus TaxID=2758039 RepID=A0A7W2D966_9ACTN|nr:acyl-CoA dehydrogenase family protein [Streptomyces himalayensis]MBA4867048.1 acyl-CoA dehydrogenase family protein [Streptomyces himalayensis subsp. aureolus]
MNSNSHQDETGALSKEAIRAELVARAVALQPLLREQAARGELDRVLPVEVVDALAEAGVFRLLTPRRYGGYETDLRTLTEVSEALGEGDGSAAWVGMIISVTNWLACLFPDKAQEEVFGTDPDARVTGVAAPTGMGERVPGGWRVSGKWSYNSGAPHATWAAVGALLKDDSGAVVDQALVLIPASELTVEDTWHTAGMKATASNTLIGRDVFVPEHRVLSVPAAAEGTYPRASREEALYGSTFGPMLLLCLVGPLLGLGRAAMQAAVEAAAQKPLSFTVHSRQADSVGVQIQLAEAALKLETARLHTYRAVDEVDQAASSGGPLDYAARAHVRARAGFAAQQVLEAIGTLLNVHGASSFAYTSPLQRIWRDAGVAARHAGLVPAVGLEVYGKSLLGISDRVSLMV